MTTCCCGNPSRPEWYHSERACHGMAVTSADLRGLRVLLGLTRGMTLERREEPI